MLKFAGYNSSEQCPIQVVCVCVCVCVRARACVCVCDLSEEGYAYAD